MSDGSLKTQVRVQGFSEVPCLCGCGNLIPLRSWNRGWRYLRGHKGGASNETRAAKEQRMAKRDNPPGKAEQVGFAKTLEMARENLRRAEEHLALTDSNALSLEGSLEDARREQAKASTRTEEWRAVIAALEAVLPKPERPATEFGAIAGRMATAGVAA